jgi:hypothetical protein
LPSGGGKNVAQLRRKVSSPAVAGRVAAAMSLHRGPFSCTGRLKLLKVNSASAASSSSHSAVRSSSATPVAVKDKSNDHATPATSLTTDDTKTPSTTGVVEFEMLQAVGLGGTKREARHMASAGLLKLLFPECKDMGQVKASAVAARERYDASKALKFAAQMESRRQVISGLYRMINSSTSSGSGGGNNGNSDADHLKSFALASPEDHPLPAQIYKDFQSLLDGGRRPANAVDPAVRQASRQKQLYAFVDKALQSLNERDEEGRCLPEELTVDDVGRTVLRRAEPEDLPRILKILSTGHGNLKKKNKISGTAANLTLLGPVAVLADSTAFGSSQLGSSGGIIGNCNDHDDNDDNDTRRIISEAGRSWSCCTVILLLCRAIAAYEDPPLGCAVLTYGFSMQQGKLFRVAHLAAEPHLPRERFFECLQDFCHFSKCTLQVNQENESHAVDGTANCRRFTDAELRAIIQSHLVNRDQHTDKAVEAKVGAASTAKGTTTTTNKNNNNISAGGSGSNSNSIRLASLSLTATGSGSGGCGTVRNNTSLLSSVREESEASDDSSEKRASPSSSSALNNKSGDVVAAAAHRNSKPSKRTRVE